MCEFVLFHAEKDEYYYSEGDYSEGDYDEEYGSEYYYEENGDYYEGGGKDDIFIIDFTHLA